MFDDLAFVSLPHYLHRPVLRYVEHGFSQAIWSGQISCVHGQQMWHVLADALQAAFCHLAMLTAAGC